MAGIVYKITNTINGKVYVGQTTKTLEQRWCEHKYTNPTRKYLLHKAMDKYGRENFTIEELASAVSDWQLDELEKFWITKLNSVQPNGYNLESGGNVSKTLHESIKQKIKDSNTGFRCRQPHLKRVTCKDLVTGIEMSYPNMGEAIKDGFHRSSIGRCIRGIDYSHKGKRWKECNSETYPNVQLKRVSKDKQLRSPVMGTDKFGRVKLFKSLKDASDKGYDGSNISRCIRGLQKQYRGYIWNLVEVQVGTQN